VSPSENGASAAHVVDAPGNGGPPEPPLRLGGMSIDLAFIVVFLAIVIIRSLIG